MADAASLSVDVLTGVEMGIGTWQWGDSLVWHYGVGYSIADVRAAYDATIAAGIPLLDTAEIYGFGKSESFIGRFMRDTGTRPLIATKFFPLPWRVTRRQLLAALRGSIRRLGIDRVDLYQIHFPMPPRPVETWADALADAVEAGLARAVGVSNYSADQVQRAHDVLARRGVPLASNQVEYSLLQRGIERDGTMHACAERGVRVIAYSPLGMGLLSGRYTPDHLPGGARRIGASRRLQAARPVLERLHEIGQARGKTPAQIAINWTLCKGTLPIPGAKNARHVEGSAGALGWRLTESEVATLDAAGESYRAR